MDEFISGREMKELVADVRAADLTKSKTAYQDSLSKHSKEVMDAAKMAGVSLVSTHAKKPLQEVTKVEHHEWSSGFG